MKLVKWTSLRICAYNLSSLIINENSISYVEGEDFIIDTSFVIEREEIVIFDEREVQSILQETTSNLFKRFCDFNFEN